MTFRKYLFIDDLKILFNYEFNVTSEPKIRFQVKSDNLRITVITSKTYLKTKLECISNISLKLDWMFELRNDLLAVF